MLKWLYLDTSISSSNMRWREYYISSKKSTTSQMHQKRTTSQDHHVQSAYIVLVEFNTELPKGNKITHINIKHDQEQEGQQQGRWPGTCQGRRSSGGRGHMLRAWPWLRGGASSIHLGLRPTHDGSCCGCPSRWFSHRMGKIAPRACGNEFHHSSAASERSGSSGPCAPCRRPCHQNPPVKY